MSLVRFRLWAPFAGLAHLVERHLAKVEVASSSLVARSKKETPPNGWCFFFGAGKFASQTYPAGRLKSRGNPAKVSPANIPFLADGVKLSIFFVNTSQKRDDLQRKSSLFWCKFAAQTYPAGELKNGRCTAGGGKSEAGSRQAPDYWVRSTQ